MFEGLFQLDFAQAVHHFLLVLEDFFLCGGHAAFQRAAGVELEKLEAGRKEIILNLNA